MSFLVTEGTVSLVLIGGHSRPATRGSSECQVPKMVLGQSRSRSQESAKIGWANLIDHLRSQGSYRAKDLSTGGRTVQRWRDGISCSFSRPPKPATEPSFYQLPTHHLQICVKDKNSSQTFQDGMFAPRLSTWYEDYPSQVTDC